MGYEGLNKDELDEEHWVLLIRKAAAFDALEHYWSKLPTVIHWLAWDQIDTPSLLEAVERDLMGKEE